MEEDTLAAASIYSKPALVYHAQIALKTCLEQNLSFILLPNCASKLFNYVRLIFNYSTINFILKLFQMYLRPRLTK